MALANPGPRADPFVVRVHALFEIEIRDYAWGNISRDARNFRCHALAHSHPVENQSAIVRNRAPLPQEKRVFSA